MAAHLAAVLWVQANIHDENNTELGHVISPVSKYEFSACVFIVQIHVKTERLILVVRHHHYNIYITHIHNYV